MRQTIRLITFILSVNLVYGNGLTLIHQYNDALELEFKSDPVQLTDDGYFIHVQSHGANLLHARQMPDLPVWSCAVALPEGAQVRDSIISADTVFLQRPIVPGLGLSKGIPEGEYILGKQYRSTAAVPSQTAVLSAEYQLHNLRGQNLQYVPFRYFPQSGMLVIIKESRIIIAAPHPIPPCTEEQQHFINSTPMRRTKRGATIDKPAMLIVCTAELVQPARQFMQWKMHQGTTCYLETFPVAASPETIKAVVAQYYKKHQIQYLLIIGDAEQIPPMQYSGDSDAAYGYLAGDDAYSELAVGRISASNADDAALQLRRTERYEQHQFAPRNNTYILVASGEGPGDDDELDFDHLRGIKSRLDAAGLAQGSELYDGDRGISDAPGDPVAADLAEKINSGADLMFYIGHGSASDLRTTKLATDDTAMLANTQWPFAMIGGCQVGNFVGQTCLAEAFLRTGTATQPKGFAAVLASSNDQLWAPPMRAQDAFTDALMQNGDQRLGELLQQAMRNMITVYGADGAATAATWNLFGDPSMLLHSKLTDSILASIELSCPAGNTQMNFSCDRAGARYVLSRSGLLIAEGVTVAGKNVISTNPLLPGEYRFTIFAPNTVCFMQTVQVGLSTVPMLAISSVKTATDTAGLSIDCSHPVAAGAMIGNISESEVAVSQILFSSSSPSISVVPVNQSVPSILSGESRWIDSIAVLTCKDIAPDYSFSYTITVASSQLQSSYRGSMHALVPQYSIAAANISPTAGSNGDNIAQAGEILDISIDLVNYSAVKSAPEWLKISSSDNIVADALSYHINTDSISAKMRVAISAQAHAGEVFTISLQYGNSRYSAQSQYHGRLQQNVETWDTPSVLPWSLGDSKPWTAEQAPQHATVMRSGAIGADGKSRMQVAFASSMDDTISFTAKVSCEPSSVFGSFTDYYDYLEFSIDSVVKLKLAGEIDWHEYRFAVPSGTHVFAWEYAKDYDSDGGQDAAWLDSIVFPPASEYFDPPVVFSLPDTVTLYLNDALNQTIDLPIAADTAILFGAPQWLSTARIGSEWALQGTAGAVGAADVRVSCRFGTQFSHAATVVRVLPRPAPILVFKASADAAVINTGDSVSVEIHISNTGNAGSQAGWVQIGCLNGLLAGMDSVFVPMIPPSGNFNSAARYAAPSCLQRDTADTLSLQFYHAGETFTEQISVTIRGTNVFITAIGFDAEEINNRDSIVQTGEQLRIYATISNATDNTLPAEVSIATELGQWNADAGISARTFFRMQGDKILIPYKWELPNLHADVTVRVGQCTFSASKVLQAQQTAVAGYDSLWLAYSQDSTYTLCLPDSVEIRLLSETNGLVRDANCLSAQLQPKGDTVYLGWASIISGKATGIAKIAAATEKSTGKKPCIRQDLHWSVSKGQLAIWSGAPVSRICLAHVSGITIYDGRLVTGQPLSISGLPCGMYLVSYESGHASGCFGIYVD